MSIAHRIEIKASREAVFALYANISSWCDWDTEVQAVHLSEGLRVGSHGWLKPRQGPKAKIRVTEVVPNVSFTVEGMLPLCRMEFGHELLSQADCTVAAHSVRFVGPLAFLFRRLIGRGIDSTLPDTLAGLKRASERSIHLT